MILNNLIGNSIRYLQKISDSEKLIQIKAIKKENRLTIEISDTGPGLNAEIKEYLKKPFNKEIEYPGGGFGIGFSREMANMLGGDLTISGKKPFKTGIYLSLIIGG